MPSLELIKENLEFLGILGAGFIGLLFYLKARSKSDAEEQYGEDVSKAISEKSSREGSVGGGDGNGGEGGV